MSNDRMMQAIGRIERALGKLEKLDFPVTTIETGDQGLRARHENLKSETRAAIADLDILLQRIVA